MHSDHHHDQPQGAASGRDHPGQDAVEIVPDPVCGLQVNPDSAPVCVCQSGLPFLFRALP